MKPEFWVAAARENGLDERHMSWTQWMEGRIGIAIVALGSPAEDDGTPRPRLLGTLEATLKAAGETGFDLDTVKEQLKMMGALMLVLQCIPIAFVYVQKRRAADAKGA